MKLDECTRIVAGATPSTSVDEYWNGDICWATPKDLSDLDTPYLDDTPRKITQSGLANCAAEILPINSVLFSSRAPIGHVAINRVPTATNQGFKSFIPDTTKLTPGFLFHWLRANRAYLESLGNGATFKEVSKATVSRIEIDLPPVDEQQRISKILDEAETLRAKRRQALAKLNILTQSLFLDLFGNSTNPHKWPIVGLGEFFHFTTGKLDSNAAIADGAYPFFTCSRENFRIDRYAFDCEALLLAGNNATADYSVKHYKGKFNAYQRTYVITLKNVDHSYLYAKATLERKLSEMKRFSKGSNTKYLTLGILKDIQIQVPPIELQQEFERQAALLEGLERTQEVSLSKLNSLFASLQHRAFRGEL